MTRTSQALGGVALLLGGAALGMALSRGGPSGADTSLAAEVARLKTLAETQADRIARLEGARGSSSAEAPRSASTVAGGEGSPAGVDLSPPSGSVERGRKVLADLRANTDGTREAALRVATEEFVRVGDPIVPDIVEVLDSGFDRRYVEGKPHLQHVKGYPGLRKVLLDALREIGTPAAKRALVEAVGRSRTVSDFRDFTYPNRATTDPVLAEGITALIPAMFGSLAAEGLSARDGTYMDLVSFLTTWIRKRGLTDAVGPMEDFLRRIPSGLEEDGLTAYAEVFEILVELDPERAAQVLLPLLEKYPKPETLGRFTRTLEYGMPRATLVRFYGPLLSSGDMAPDLRVGLYQSIPGNASREIRDLARRAADTEALVAFLEARIEAESEEVLKDLIRRKIEALRKDMETWKK